MEIMYQKDVVVDLVVTAVLAACPDRDLHHPDAVRSR